MSEHSEDRFVQEDFEKGSESEERTENEGEREVLEKDFVPHFFPTFRVNRKLYPLPIIIVVFFAGLLAYITYVIAGIQIDGGYFPEEEFGITGALLNGLIFTGMAVISGFIIIYVIKKKGINVLKYVFGISFGFISFLLTLFFGEVILFLVFNALPSSPNAQFYYDISYFIMMTLIGVLTVVILYKYFTTSSINTKNAIILYIGLMTGAQFGVIMPLWTTLAILVGISLWDIFAVLYKKGPIREMMDLASESMGRDLSEEEERKLEEGEVEYDTSKLEIGIGDLVFYSMLTSSALIQSNSLLVMVFTALAIIAGTGITISGLKRSKILPGLPISIFLGIGTMLLSWFIISLI